MAGSPHAPSAAPPADLLTGVFDCLDAAVLILDARFERGGLTIQHANPAAARTFGYVVEQLVGLPHGCLHVQPDDVQAARRWLVGLPDSAPFLGEGLMRREDDSRLIASWTFTPLYGEDHEVTHIVAVYRDITQQSRLREEAAHAQRLEAVSRLAGGVAHDFNNLVSVIRGYCEILGETIGDHPKARKEVGEIHEASQRAAELVRQLLVLSRRQAVTPQVIEPNRFLEKNRTILSHLLGPAAKLQLDLAPDAANLQVDPAQLQQALLNLVINARDAINPDGVVTVSTVNRTVPPGRNRRSTDLRPGDYVNITVADDGCGMDASTQAAAFEPYFTTKPEGIGTGLGLALVHGIVRQNSGHVILHSTVGAGTTFELLFPAVQTGSTEFATNLGRLPGSLGHEHVLLIEHDPVVRRMVAEALSTAGYHVTAVARAAAVGPALARTNATLHLVIADAQPDQETVLQALHGQYPDLALIRLPDAEPATLSWLDIARQVVLPKPISLHALLRAARDLLDDRT